MATSARQNVVIVGGGMAGLLLFNQLYSTLDASKYDLVFISARDHYVHYPGALRMVTSPQDDLEDRVLLPFGPRFNKDNKKLVIGAVTSIVEKEDKSGGHVVLEDGQKVEWAFLVLTTGGKWRDMVDLPLAKSNVKAHIDSWKAKFENSNDIVLVGGGVVGVELAGELKDFWPKKNVTIVHASETLLNPAYPQKFRQQVTRRIIKLGVNLILSDYLDTTASQGEVTTRSGKAIVADLIVQTRGFTPNTQFISSSLGTDALSDSGFVKVLPTLQLSENHPRIFAGGDIIDWPEQKQSVRAYVHASIIAKNVLALSKGKQPPAKYTSSFDVTLISLGKLFVPFPFNLTLSAMNAINNFFSTLFCSSKSQSKQVAAEDKKNIVIVGGGFAGVSVFNALYDSVDASMYNLILVSARDYFAHYPATIRMVVIPEEELENSKLVVGKVVSIHESDDKTGGHVTLEDGQKIDWSFLVLTPGGKWQGPVNLPDAKKDNSAFINSWRAKFEKANDVVIIGGGAVGIEFAGEVKEFWPHKNVTIVHGQPLLLNSSYPKKFRDDAGRRVTSIGVNLVLSDFLDSTDISSNGIVKTRKGKEISADLVITTRGFVPNTDFIAASLGDDTLTESKLAKILPTFQLVNHPRIFAGGDIIDWEEQKQAAKCTGHSAVIAKNVTALSRAQTPSAVYKGQTEAILISIGKSRGTAFIGVLWGFVLGDWFTSMIKSKSLLVEMMRGQMKLDSFAKSA
ncbi:hypothetical protein CVT24_011712 [Panaeolus cyanescens]|uniref:FAD/NAD(P)-binding domain-containing protein n=1 Tax=Panaeolus cyanescens TaxID=181874 RepID=A0A409YH71_9AGAR|nr:hypothetical protein CVT24_011712 [Panaeolus cyanescens]